MSIHITHHAAIPMPLHDSRSSIELEHVAPTWSLKELQVSAPSKEMLVGLLISIQKGLNKVFDELEVSHEDRTA